MSYLETKPNFYVNMVILLIILVSTRSEIFVNFYEVMVNVGDITIIRFYAFSVTKVSIFSLLL